MRKALCQRRCGMRDESDICGAVEKVSFDTVRTSLNPTSWRNLSFKGSVHTSKARWLLGVGRNRKMHLLVTSTRRVNLAFLPTPQQLHLEISERSVIIHVCMDWGVRWICSWNRFLVRTWDVGDCRPVSREHLSTGFYVEGENQSLKLQVALQTCKICLQNPSQVSVSSYKSVILLQWPEIKTFLWKSTWDWIMDSFNEHFYSKNV